MSFLTFILVVLAVWRITHLLAAEDGPFNLLAWLRRQAGAGFWGSLMDCFYCLSLWIAAPFAFVMGRTWSEKLLLWPAISGAAILLDGIPENQAPEQPIFVEKPSTNHEEKK